MTAEYILSSDAPYSIIIEGKGSLAPFVEFMGGRIVETFQGNMVEVDFTTENANKLRQFLRGKDVEIPLREKVLLAYLADNPKALQDENLLWSLDLTKLQQNKAPGRFTKIKTEWDLIHYMPLRYLDKTNPQSVQELQVGAWAVIAGTIAVQPDYNSKKDYVKFVITDIHGSRISATFFRQKWLAWKFKQDDEVIVYGNYSEYVNPRGSRYPQIINPKMDKIVSGQSDRSMIPIYPQKSEDKSWQLKIAQEKLIDRIVWIEDPIPERILTKYGFITRTEAYKKIHFPNSREDVEAARKRIAFDEFIRLQLFLLNRKKNVESNPSGEKTLTNWATQFVKALPFSFTGAQERVIKEILEDMKQNKPMNRLLQGDVGSGKAQPLYSKILTPTGFTTMGKIKPGDIVLTPDGKNTKVIGVFPQGFRPVYELSFRDGTKVHADKNHLWNMHTIIGKYHDNAHKTLTTLELKKDLALRNGQAKWNVEYPTIVGLGSKWSSIINPYLLGCLLGNKNIIENKITFSVQEDNLEIIKHMSNVIPDTLCIEQSKKHVNFETNKTVYEYQIVNKFNSNHHNTVIKENQVNVLVEELKQLQLSMTSLQTEFIPKSLLQTDENSRLAILQGLLDMEDLVENDRTYSFSLESKQLAEDITWLIRSLGCKAKMVHKPYESDKKYFVSGYFLGNIIPFQTEQNIEKFVKAPIRKDISKALLSITYLGEKPTQCIKLEDPKGLYITDNFTVTHNTEISSVAALVAAESSYQVALLAPTDILAGQLYDRLQNTFTAAGLTEQQICLGLINGKVKGKARKTLLENVENGNINILVGTHAILQKDVRFKSLGLAIIDEQHKFGTEQRTALLKVGEDGLAPDMLSMSATPIPRSSAAVLYGDLDISIVDELPAERIPIKTEWHDTPDLAWVKIREEVEKGNQAYVVASLVEDSDKMENIESAEATYQLLSNKVFPDLKIGLLHGRLDKNEKKRIIESFYNNEIQILVATSIIEVGINIKKASIITILNANRFGIASLHQIRGRVGRSSIESFCYLVGEATVPEAEERLNALVASNDGFWLSEKDLEIRGEGTLFGQIQSGSNDLFIGNLKEHKDLLELAKTVAKQAASSKLLQKEVTLLFADKIVQR